MRILLYLKSLIFRVINKLFGRTTFFIVLLGSFLVITGIWMLLSSKKAKSRLAGQGFWFVKGYLLIMALFLGMFLLSISGKMSGILSLVILIAGIALLLRAYLLLRKKASLKIKAWVEKVPLKFLKVYAVIQIAIGLTMLLLHKRIWY